MNMVTGIPSTQDIAKHLRMYMGLGLRVAPKQVGRKWPGLPRWNETRWDYASVMSHVHSGFADGLCMLGGRMDDGRIILYVDFDGEEAVAVGRGWYVDCRTGFVQRTPSGGIHLGYIVQQEYRSHTFKDAGIDFRCVGKGKDAGAQVVGAPSFYKYSPAECKRKGLPLGHSGNYVQLGDGKPAEANAAIVARIDKLLGSQGRLFDKPRPQVEARRRRVGKPNPVGGGGTDVDRARAMLGHILPSWGSRDYSEWLSMIMSAHAMSGGDVGIRELIAGHSGISWSDGDKGRDAFRRAWDRLNAGGAVTAGTLVKLYKDAGGEPLGNGEPIVWTRTDGLTDKQAEKRARASAMMRAGEFACRGEAWHGDEYREARRLLFKLSQSYVPRARAVRYVEVYAKGRHGVTLDPARLLSMTAPPRQLATRAEMGAAAEETEDAPTNPFSSDNYGYEGAVYDDDGGGDIYADEPPADVACIPPQTAPLSDLTADKASIADTGDKTAIQGDMAKARLRIEDMGFDGAQAHYAAFMQRMEREPNADNRKVFLSAIANLKAVWGDNLYDPREPRRARELPPLSATHWDGTPLPQGADDSAELYAEAVAHNAANPSDETQTLIRKLGANMQGDVIEVRAGDDIQASLDLALDGAYD